MPTVAVSQSLLDLSQCPICRSHLTEGESTWNCQNVGCGATFPCANGIPILLNESKSVFEAQTFLSKRATFFKPRGRLRATLSDCLPTEQLNVAAERVLADMRNLLLKRSMTPRVLVLGGGILGAGMQVFANDPHIELVETDVSLEERTQLICDGHDLPFRDGTFDGVIVQATLEHVVDPYRCLQEIERVLRPEGLVYSDTPFMQQVHGREFDFTRFTKLGHRRLFRNFEEIDSGISVGPASALAWSIRYFLLSFFESRTSRRVVSAIARCAVSWLKYFDLYLAKRAAATDAASAFYFLGQKNSRTLPDKELLAQYKGGF